MRWTTSGCSSSRCRGVNTRQSLLHGLCQFDVCCASSSESAAYVKYQATMPSLKFPSPGFFCPDFDPNFAAPKRIPAQCPQRTRRCRGGRVGRKKTDVQLMISTANYAEQHRPTEGFFRRLRRWPQISHTKECLAADTAASTSLVALVETRISIRRPARTKFDRTPDNARVHCDLSRSVRAASNAGKDGSLTRGRESPSPLANRLLLYREDSQRPRESVRWPEDFRARREACRIRGLWKGGSNEERQCPCLAFTRSKLQTDCGCVPNL
jgi:hypothetical protein